MLASTIIAAVAAGSFAAASPIAKRAADFNVTDTLILQYALTLEHLEATFYAQALEKFDASAFESAGFAPWVRNRFEQIAGHEASHVAILTGALGADAPAACNYSFGYTDPVSFASLSAVIEDVGISAYLGAAADITDTAYITIAGSILSVENQHQTWVQAAVDEQNGWSSPYATPAGFNMVYTIVAPFFTSCPSTNPTLPFTAYPSVTATGVASNATATLTYDDSTSTEKYLIVYYGLSVTAVPIAADKTVVIPDIQGIAYAMVSSSDNTTVVDTSSFVAGPLVINEPFASTAINPATPAQGQ